MTPTPRKEQRVINTTDLDRRFTEHEWTIATATTGGWKVTRQATRRRATSPVTIAPVLFRVRHWLAPTGRTAGPQLP